MSYYTSKRKHLNYGDDSRKEKIRKSLLFAYNSVIIIIIIIKDFVKWKEILKLIILVLIMREWKWFNSSQSLRIFPYCSFIHIKKKNWRSSSATSRFKGQSSFQTLKNCDVVYTIANLLIKKVNYRIFKRRRSKIIANYNHETYSTVQGVHFDAYSICLKRLFSKKQRFWREHNGAN